MNDSNDVPEHLKDLIDEYLSGCADEQGVSRLEELLAANEASRNYFVRYCRLHTDLYQSVRASQASKSVLTKLEAISMAPDESIMQTVPAQKLVVNAGALKRHALKIWIAAAAIVFALLASFYFSSLYGQTTHTIAWVKNAQNCAWEQDLLPTGDMKPGKVLALERGFVEIGFESGANLILEGPARLELLSGKSAKLLYGKMAARVPKSARGFSIVSPQGEVVDLGTEFGMSVAQNGATEVFVFQGEVKAISKDDLDAKRNAISISESHGARIESNRVSLSTGGEEAKGRQFVRQIPSLPVITPRVIRLDFGRAVPGTILDAAGMGTGLTHRLVGTGEKLPTNDLNLKLNLASKQLELTTTNSDINRRFHIDQGEYLGFRLSDMGFTGTEDFSIEVTIPNIPTLNPLGQFGLYAGARNDRSIRGGLISGGDNHTYKFFMANNNGGNDSNAHFVGVQSSGEDMRMMLRREAGKYSLTVENLTAGSSSAVAIKHPDFLDAERDLYVGLFGANTQSELQRTLYIKEIVVTVWAPRTSVAQNEKP